MFSGRNPPLLLNTGADRIYRKQSQRILGVIRTNTKFPARTGFRSVSDPLELTEKRAAKAMPVISIRGNNSRENGSILVDAAFAILILCIGLGIAAFALGAAVPQAAKSISAAGFGITERGNHEAQAFDIR